MWSRAEGVALLDEDGIVRAVSRNEDEARIRHVIGTRIIEERAIEVDKPKAIEAFQAALEGKETELELGAIADDGQVIWGRTVLKPSPLPETPVLLHSRSLPESWGALSDREKQVINGLHQAQLNPKRAAQQLGITNNTFNAHRRSISQKCQLHEVGDFWVFVERCR